MMFLVFQISLHIGFLHSAINPCVHMMLDPGIRAAITRTFCCTGDPRTARSLARRLSKGRDMDTKYKVQRLMSMSRLFHTPKPHIDTQG